MAGFTLPGAGPYGQQPPVAQLNGAGGMLPLNAPMRRDGFQRHQQYMQQRQHQHQHQQHQRQQQQHQHQQHQQQRQSQRQQQQDEDTSWDRIGTLTAAERAEKIEKFRAKRGKRNFVRKVKYRGREALANSRVRIKGRFVPKEVQNAYLELQKEHPEWNFKQLQKAVLETKDDDHEEALV